MTPRRFFRLKCWQLSLSFGDVLCTEEKEKWKLLLELKKINGEKYFFLFVRTSQELLCRFSMKNQHWTILQRLRYGTRPLRWFSTTTKKNYMNYYWNSLFGRSLWIVVVTVTFGYGTFQGATRRRNPRIVYGCMRRRWRARVSPMQWRSMMMHVMIHFMSQFWKITNNFFSFTSNFSLKLWLGQFTLNIFKFSLSRKNIFKKSFIYSMSFMRKRFRIGKKIVFFPLR